MSEPGTIPPPNTRLNSENGRTVRGVFFKEQAEKLIGSSSEKIITAMESDEIPAIMNKIKQDVVGRNLTLLGRVKYNEFSDQLEYIIDEIL